MAQGPLEKLIVPHVTVNFHAFYENRITLPHLQHSQLVPIQSHMNPVLTPTVFLADPF